MFRQNPLVVLATFLSGFALVVVASSFSIRSDEAQPDAALFQRRCGGCHSLDRDKEGPRLQGVYGRTAGTVDSFTYSDALKKSKLVWNDDTLEKWLTDTEKLVPGNEMAFHVENAAERRRIIAFLKQNSGH